MWEGACVKTGTDGFHTKCAARHISLTETDCVVKQAQTEHM